MSGFSTLTDLMHYVLASYRNSTHLNFWVKDTWQTFSTEKFIENVRRASLGLYQLGIKKGDSVGILAQSSPSWLVADMAIMVNGAVTVPMFTYLSKKNFDYQVQDANLKALFVLGKDAWYSFENKLKIELPIVISQEMPNPLEGVVTWQELLLKGDEVSNRDPRLFVKQTSQVMPEDLATIIYTSGTTGTPKGVRLTHGNIVSQIHAAADRFPLKPEEDRVLSVLPLAHIFERTLMYYYLSCGVSIYFADTLSRTALFFKKVQPTLCAIVPRILEKIHKKIVFNLGKEKFLKKFIGNWALSLAKNPSKSLWKKVQRQIAKKIVYKKLKTSFGGKVKALISGGAPLDRKLNTFFMNIGVPVFQGYGLTEAAPVVSTNYPGNNKPGTVGPPFPGIELKFSENAEICVKGPNIMKGYWGDIESSIYVDEQGWLHTGDCGKLDEEGYLYITGRVKELYKTSAGKYVSPVPIEQALVQSPLVDMAVIVGEAKQFVVALLFPDYEHIKAIKGSLEIEDFLQSKAVKQEIKHLIKEVNASLNQWEQIAKFCFINKKISIEGGELTPTLKLKRKIVLEKFKKEIDALYGEKCD
jgi:long-chain acyl-CoA synthetase